MISVIACLGTLLVPRLRIGIGTPGSGNRIGWVLGHLGHEETERLPDVLERVAEGVEAWLSLDLERAMSKVNVKSPKEEK